MTVNSTLTSDALVKRINRALQRQDEYGLSLRKCRAKNMWAFLDHGDYYLIDVRSNGLVERDVDIHALASELGVLPPGTLNYLFKLPKAIPSGQVLVHNHVQPTRRLGSRGFRAWLSPSSKGWQVCHCGFAPELGRHFWSPLPGRAALKRVATPKKRKLTWLHPD